MCGLTRADAYIPYIAVPVHMAAKSTPSFLQRRAEFCPAQPAMVNADRHRRNKHTGAGAFLP